MSTTTAHPSDCMNPYTRSSVGLEKAGIEGLEFVEFNHAACDTLRKNRPNWNVVEGDVHKVDFKPYYGKIDLVSGGAPCQAFSWACRLHGRGQMGELQPSQ